MMEHMTAYLSDLLCGFRQGYNAQHAITHFLEKCKIYLDTGGKAGAVFMDLSKAFDCVKHDLLIAKLHAYGFNHDALTFLYSYLSDRQQRVKMNGSFSSKQKLNLGVPQGSVLGPLLFNIYLNDLLISVDDIEICNYADDTTLYTCDQNLQNVVERLENVSLKVIKWFSDNYLKLNEDKCHFLALGASRDEPVTSKIGNASLQNSTQEKLLGITIDNKLTFEHHVAGLCQKASNKLYALSRIAPFMDQGKLRYLMRAFINRQFQYCPLVWMFHSRQLRNKIDKIQERALRVTYQDSESSLEALMENDRSITVHQRNLQYLMTEMYKTKNGLNPAFMREIFCQ